MDGSAITADNVNTGKTINCNIYSCLLLRYKSQTTPNTISAMPIMATAASALVPVKDVKLDSMDISKG